MARKKKAMDFSSLDLNLDALGDWGGDEEKAEKEFIRAAKLNLSPVTWDNAEAAGQPAEQRTGASCTLQTDGISGCITGVLARANAMQSPERGIWISERSKAWHGVR